MRITSTVAGFWDAFSARERAAVALALVFALGAALYLLLWAPGMAARQSLESALPRLRAQLEDMRWQRDEVVALRKKAGASSARGEAAAILRASVAQAPFASAIERVDALPAGKARVQAGPVAFDAWLAWAANLHRELGVRVEQCRVQALEEPGMVRVDATFSGGSAQ